MELVKDIYFNTDKLIENTKIKISYTGKFYEGDNDKVYLHYGYGENWNNVNELEMKKTDLGYQAELHLPSTDTLNFCFKNQDNEWDNNFGKNYIFNIEKKVTPIAESTKKTNFTIFGKTFENKFISNTNIFDISSITSKTENIASNVTNNNESTSENTQNNINSITETSITVVPTGFKHWTNKIKETVWNFFSYVPKLISGNYKRNINNENQENQKEQ